MIKITRFFIQISLILILALFVACSVKPKEEPQKPNILFIMLDDLGKEWIGAYGGEGVNTPTIDKLTSTGILFENVYSMPQCTPSRVTLLTGQYPWKHGWVNHYDVPRWGNGGRFDPEQNPSYPKYLQEAGYKTCIAGKWQINDFRLEPAVLNEVGFDEYCMWTGAEGGNVEKSKERYWNPYIHTKEGSRTYEGEFGEDIFSDFIIDFMRQNQDDPMMIYYPMCLPHTPFTTTPLAPDAPREEQYAAMIKYTDFILAKLLNALEELKLRENTIVIWTTDNGSANGIVGNRNGKRVRGGKSYLSENGLNAPFIVNCPGVVPEGKVSDALIDFTDMLPTFCELAGVQIPTDVEFQGHSIAKVIMGEKTDSDRNWILGMGSHPAQLKNGRIATAFDFRDRVIRDKDYKAYVDTLGQIHEIIDLKNDFYEQNNLLDSKREELKLSKNKFQNLLQTFPEKDYQPKYKKGQNAIYNITETELQKKCINGKQKPNKTKPF
jgi:arylsulfatase A-like enzyme